MISGRRGLARLQLLADVGAAAMFIAVFVTFCAKIVARYAEHLDMAWADEISIILFIWIIFWANALILGERDHIKFDLVTHLMPPQGKRAMAIVRNLLVAGLFLYVTPGTVDYIHFLWRERTPVLGLRLDYVYSCFGLFIATVPMRAAWQVVRLCGPEWRSQV